MTFRGCRLVGLRRLRRIASPLLGSISLFRSWSGSSQACVWRRHVRPLVLGPPDVFPGGVQGNEKRRSVHVWHHEDGTVAKAVDCTACGGYDEWSGFFEKGEAEATRREGLDGTQVGHGDCCLSGFAWFRTSVSGHRFFRRDGEWSLSQFSSKMDDSVTPSRHHSRSQLPLKKSEGLARVEEVDPHDED